MSVTATRRSPAVVVVLTVLLGCGPASPLSSPPTLVADADGLRAKVSACLGSNLSSAVAFFGPAEAGGVSDDEVRCAQAASDCVALLACLGLGGPPCTDDGARCEDGVAVRCRRLPNEIGREVREDCNASAAGNTACAVIDDQGKGMIAVCNAGPCGAGRCDGDVAISCLAGVALRVDCAASGRGCAIDGIGAFCALHGPCARDRCDGDTLVSCRAGRVEYRLDCDDVVPGGRCRDQQGAVDCVASAWDAGCPAGQPYTSWCEGEVGVACHVGVRLEIDCPAFLDGQCVPGSSSTPARCQIPGWP